VVTRHAALKQHAPEDHMRVHLITAAALLLLLIPSFSGAQEVRGRVVEAGSDAILADVKVTAYDDSGVARRSVSTGPDGQFIIFGVRPGDYTLTFEHIGYATHRTGVVRLRNDETVVLRMQMSPVPLAIDPLTVTARRRQWIHQEPTYGGLYARIDRSNVRIGPNRIIVKGDLETQWARRVSDVIGQQFYRASQRLRNACVYWNGHLAGAEMAAALLEETRIDELEALEVYTDWLSAPPSMRGPPPRPLQTTCSVVIGMWAMRPDLPGRQ
jgi:hypothetical protein